LPGRHSSACESRTQAIAELTQPDTTSTRQDVIRQAIKWTVYSLLLINWGYYIFDDWRAAQHTLVAGDPLLKWMNSYATSIDELAWFGLLFLFEAETYWLSKDALDRVQRFALVTMRIACYGFLLHTMYAYWINYLEFVNALALPPESLLCDLVGQHYSFLRNLTYTVVDAGNCGTLTSTGELFRIGGDPVVTDAAGKSEALWLAVIDLIDVTTWLAVVLVIELIVVLQERGTSGGPLITWSNYLTVALYSVLVFNACYWMSKGHWVYAWDELLWIGGFAAIEMNLSEWRDELSEAAVST
jgi:hypothetical protein